MVVSGRFLLVVGRSLFVVGRSRSFRDLVSTDISDHFPIFTISVKHRLDSSDKKSNNKKESNKCRLDSRIQRYFV